VFPAPGFDRRWGVPALLVACLAAAALLALARARLPRPLWLGAALALAFALDLAVAAVRGGPGAWSEPISHPGEYAPAAGLVGPIPDFLRHFAQRLPEIGGFVAQHPPLAVIVYALVARVQPGLTAAALATVAGACLGLVVTVGLARDARDALRGDREGADRSEGVAPVLPQRGPRAAATAAAGPASGPPWAAVLWALCPAVVLYSATSADAMWAPLLAGAALAAHRGLARRSLGWTLAGGALLWLASLATYAAVLVLPFLAVRALAVAASGSRVGVEPLGGGGGSGGWPWVARWAALTTATVLALAALLRLTAGYDVVAVTRAVIDFWATAPGGGARSPWPWVFGAPVAFLAMLGFPLAAALLAGWWRALRRHAWGSFELAFLACIVAGVAWGHSKGEVERMWGFLLPFAVVIATRQLGRWHANLTAVAGLLLAQTLAVETLFYTRW
jgi:hypothetical protein